MYTCVFWIAQVVPSERGPRRPLPDAPRWLVRWLVARPQVRSRSSSPGGSAAGPAGSESPSSSTKSNGPGFRVVWAGDEEERTGQRSGSLSSRVERVRVLGRGQQGAAVLMKDPITEELLVAKEVQIDGMSEDQRKGVENEVRPAAAPPAARSAPHTPHTSRLTPPFDFR